MRRTASLVLTLVAACTLSGCSLGRSWDVRMEVTGPGSAVVGTKFAGEPDQYLQQATTVPLPFTESRNVGFGFDELAVRGAAPGTVCRVFVDDRLRTETPADRSGAAACRVNNQDEDR